MFLHFAAQKCKKYQNPGITLSFLWWFGLMRTYAEFARCLLCRKIESLTTRKQHLMICGLMCFSLFTSDVTASTSVTCRSETTLTCYFITRTWCLHLNKPRLHELYSHSSVFLQRHIDFGDLFFVRWMTCPLSFEWISFPPDLFHYNTSLNWTLISVGTCRCL